jgi:hypothetical protein
MSRYVIIFINKTNNFHAQRFNSGIYPNAQSNDQEHKSDKTFINHMINQ